MNPHYMGVLGHVGFVYSRFVYLKIRCFVLWGGINYIFVEKVPWVLERP